MSNNSVDSSRGLWLICVIFFLLFLPATEITPREAQENVADSFHPNATLKGTHEISCQLLSTGSLLQNRSDPKQLINDPLVYSPPGKPVAFRTRRLLGVIHRPLYSAENSDPPPTHRHF